MNQLINKYCVDSDESESDESENKEQNKFNFPGQSRKSYLLLQIVNVYGTVKLPN